ncbi:MFS general substrate transporter [Stereum hirsutum FP-91666 SS1]|uniref:MFS general substrate transporter n=1 Tax=Stereum hirsutum (strain FP-91666) TaxID=721885 RepID=UPI0004409DEA|nr:MFS general substrate transporter [Stereum hirsutum FP-91666 SS1]EIM89147.1 MFS general substrate transporter [Stereum hirsutum FP-91666 SS1]
MSPTTATDERTPLIHKTQTPDQLSRSHFIILLTGLWTLTFIGSLDGTIVATLISLIGSSFEALQYSSWIGTSYLLSVCCFTPLYGRLCNIIGRRASAILAGGLFGIGTALCGFARSMKQLLIFRTLAGVGGGGMAVVGNVIVSDAVPLKSRGIYQGFANLLFALGGAIGAPLGGWLGDTIGWRAAFLIQSPLLLAGLIIVYIYVREPASFLSSSSSSTFSKLKRIDYLGSLTLVLTLGSLLVGMTVKESEGGSTKMMVGFLVASAVFLVLFLLVEVKFAVEPVMPLSLLKRRNPCFVALNNFLIAFLSFSTVYNVPLYFTAARLRSSTDAGRHLITNSLCVAVGSLLAGWYMRKSGKYWWYEVCAAAGIVVANVVLASWSGKTPEWILYITLMPSGFGFSTVLTTTLLALFASVPREQIPVATGVSYLFRTTGQVLGVSLSSTLTQSLLAKNLRERITVPNADEIISKILDSTAYIRTLDPELRRMATDSWAQALKVVFTVQIVIAVLLLLTLLPIKEYPLPDKVQAPTAAPTASDSQGQSSTSASASTSGTSTPNQLQGKTNGSEDV